MRVIIAGSRSVTDVNEVYAFIEAAKPHDMVITEVVCGMAAGVDLIGRQWAFEYTIPVKEFPADWDKYGRAAGPIRNKQMGDYADAAIVIYNPKISKGSKNMIEVMKKLQKPVYVVEL